MKQIVLSSLILLNTFFSLAQVEIYEFNDPNTDYSGGIYEMNPFAIGQQHVDFLVTNSTGTDQPWRITRKRINEINTWTDYLCWGNFGQLGNCYPVSTMTTNPWTTPFNDTPTLPDGSMGLLKIYIDPQIMPVSTDVTYRYYVGLDSTSFMDSVDVKFQWYASTNNLPSIEVSVAPNPANDYVNIKTNSINNATVTMVDVLGNIIYSNLLSNNKSIDIRALSDGVYFISVKSEQLGEVTRRIIVRH